MHDFLDFDSSRRTTDNVRLQTQFIIPRFVLSFTWFISISPPVRPEICLDVSGSPERKKERTSICSDV